jgi:hypothetical protein
MTEWQTTTNASMADEQILGAGIGMSVWVLTRQAYNGRPPSRQPNSQVSLTYCSLCVPTGDRMRCNTPYRELAGADQVRSEADSEPTTVVSQRRLSGSAGARVERQKMAVSVRSSRQRRTPCNANLATPIPTVAPYPRTRAFGRVPAHRSCARRYSSLRVSPTHSLAAPAQTLRRDHTV